ncbi:hypothetical protein ABIE12_003292 [Serratia sp. 509]
MAKATQALLGQGYQLLSGTVGTETLLGDSDEVQH